jgi:hypothetical protein
MPSVTAWGRCRISSSRPISAGQKPVIAEFCKKFPVLRQNPSETGSHMTAHTTKPFKHLA